eukprot:scaffold211166_cov47-Prasinocladus_malaysianus.AAC.1
MQSNAFSIQDTTCDAMYAAASNCWSINSKQTLHNDDQALYINGDARSQYCSGLPYKEFLLMSL